MECPQCGMDQPAGVTICGFCGAPVVALPPRRAAAPAPAGARSGRARPRRGRWLLLLLASAAVAVVLGPRRRPAAPPAVPPAAPEETRAAPGAATAGHAAPAAPARLPALRDGRLSDEWLGELAAELELRAEAGDVEALAALVDPRVRFRSSIDDGRQVRRLDAGLPELLAHWLTPWLAAEASGLAIHETFDVREVAVAAGGRSGRISRRIEPATDPSRVRFPDRLLGDLAHHRELDASELEAVDFAALDGVACGVDEGIRVGETARGYRVVNVERVGSCASGRR